MMAYSTGIVLTIIVSFFIINLNDCNSYVTDLMRWQSSTSSTCNFSVICLPNSYRCTSTSDCQGPQQCCVNEDISVIPFIEMCCSTPSQFNQVKPTATVPSTNNSNSSTGSSKPPRSRTTTTTTTIPPISRTTTTTTTTIPPISRTTTTTSPPRSRTTITTIPPRSRTTTTTIPPRSKTITTTNPPRGRTTTTTPRTRTTKRVNG